MARRSSIRQQAALKSVDYIGSQYAVRNEMNRKDIGKKSFERREKSIDDMFAFAGQALGVLDKWSAKKAEDIKIGKSVTSMAGKEGGEISYKKPKIADWIKGEAKFSEIGKESWNIGGQDYSRADMLAYDKFEQKNKWEDKIGEDMKTTSTYTTDGSGNRIEIPVSGINKTEPKDKAYTLKGSTEAIEKEHGAGWSYNKQKAINKSMKAEAYEQKKVERGQKRLEKTLSRNEKRGEKEFSSDLKGAFAREDRRESKAASYDQVVGLAGQPGKDFDKAMSAYEVEYGKTEQTKALKRDRKDFVKENPYMSKGTDAEAMPSQLEDLVDRVKDWSSKTFSKKGRKTDIFQNITKETKSKSEVGEALNADTTFAESDKSYAPKDVGEDSQTFYDVDEGDAGDIKPGGVPSGRNFLPEGTYKFNDPNAESGSGGIYSHGQASVTARDKTKMTNAELWEGAGDSKQAGLEPADPPVKTEPEKPRKRLAAGGIERTLDYLKGDMAFDDTISSEGLTLSPSSIDKKLGTASFSLYGDEGNQLYENAMTVKLDEQGEMTRNLVDIAPTFKKWSGMSDMTGGLKGNMDALQKQLLALAKQ